MEEIELGGITFVFNTLNTRSAATPTGSVLAYNLSIKPGFHVFTEYLNVFSTISSSAFAPPAVAGSSSPNASCNSRG